MDAEGGQRPGVKGRGRLKAGHQKAALRKRGNTPKNDEEPARNPSMSPGGSSRDIVGDGEGLNASRRIRRGPAKVGQSLKGRSAEEASEMMRAAAGRPRADQTEEHKEGKEGGPVPAWKKHHLRKYVGAHLSIQGGIWKAVGRAVQIGARAFGLFLRSQRSWSSKPLEGAAAERFRQACMEHGFRPEFILPHSPYLMNLGSPRPDVHEKSRAMLVEELQRCRQLGLTLYNLHPGSRVGAMSVDRCLDRIADSLNYAHEQVDGVTTVLENMSCQGTTVGGRFEELHGIIERVADKARVGVCLDTCHAFAAGHDLSQQAGLQEMLKEFNQVVGLQYLKALHLNDSKGPLGCHLDRHQNIGRGHIGLEGFRHVMNEPRFDGLPLILETPATEEGNNDAEEIELLYSLCEEETEGHTQEEQKGTGAGDRK